MNVAVLGMGRMGQALGGRLLDGGHDVLVWNRTPGRASELIERGASESTTVGGAVKGIDVVFTCLANDEAVREVACGERGIRTSLAEGAVYVDASTVSPYLSAELDGIFERFAAMPILGSPSAVAGGEAVYLLGSDPSTRRDLDPVVSKLSERAIRYDTPSLATTAKLAVNLLLLDGVVALAESFSVGRAGGLSDQQLRDLLGESPVLAPGLRNRFEGVLTGEQVPWWAPSLGAKDAHLARDVAKRAGVDLPVTSVAAELYGQVDSPSGDEDIAAVSRLYGLGRP